MPLQIRRGTTTERLTITPLNGELIYDTTTNSLYVGNGIAVGGNGITATISGDLNLNNFSLVSSTNQDIKISPDGAGKVVISKDINIAGNISKTGVLNISPTLAVAIGDPSVGTPGNLVITRDNYSSNFGTGLTFRQNHVNATVVPMTFYRGRGTSAAPSATVTGDYLGELIFLGQDNSGITSGASISVQVAVNSAGGHTASRFLISTDNGTTFEPRVEISPVGTLFVNRVSGFSQLLTLVGTLDGDVTGSVFSDNSSRIIDGTSGEITTPSVTASSFVKFPVYANPAARDAALPSTAVQAGMVVFLTDNTGSGGGPKLQVNTNSTTSGWVNL